VYGYEYQDGVIIGVRYVSVDGNSRMQKYLDSRSGKSYKRMFCSDSGWSSWVEEGSDHMKAEVYVNRLRGIPDCDMPERFEVRVSVSGVPHGFNYTVGKATTNEEEAHKVKNEVILQFMSGLGVMDTKSNS
jgi:hypothetical protein